MLMFPAEMSKVKNSHTMYQLICTGFVLFFISGNSRFW